MADRFYGYQYGTNPRKLNSEYRPYKNRYPKKEEPATTKNSKTHHNKDTNSNKKTTNSKSTSITQRKAQKSRTQQRQVARNKKNKNMYIEEQQRKRKKEALNKREYIEGNLDADSRTHRTSRIVVKAKFKIVFYLVAVFSVLFAISYQDSLIDASFNQKEQSRKELQALTKTNQQIEIGIENSLNLNAVEKTAKEKLGMHKLDNSQKVYVSLPKQDYVAPANNNSTTENKDLNIFERIIKWFTGN